MEMKSQVVLKRKVEINNREFTVFGHAPWIVIPVPAIPEKGTPECHIIIEASLLAYSLHRNRHMYNALSTLGSNGASIGVAFTGENGRARATEIVNKLNFKFG